MCTLTWTTGSGSGGYELLFNRDELRTRRRALAPETALTDGVRYAAPTDRDRGGTWLGVNEYGVTHCILNSYRHGLGPASGSARSRGEIVRRVQSSTDPDHTHALLSALELEDYPPFILAGFFPGGSGLPLRTASFTWTGRKLVREDALRPPLTTSSYRSNDVEDWRSAEYHRIVGPTDAPHGQKLWKFHRRVNPGDAAFGVCMSRADARTVSCTRVVYSADRSVHIGYFDGPPCSLPDPPALATLRPQGLVSEKPLDCRQAFLERAPGMAMRVPGFGFAFLRWLLCEKRVNRLVLRYADASALEFCDAVLEELEISVSVHGRHHLVETDRPVVASNHPSGGVEGLVLMRELLRMYGDVAVPANEMLARIPSLASLIVPIDRYRGNASVLSRYDELYKGHRPVLIFPAGRTARVEGGRLREFPWQKSFVTRARRYGRRVLPVWVSGRNSWLFNGMYTLRKRFQSVPNIEMFLLVRELFGRRGDTVDLVFGAPGHPVPASDPGAAEDALTARRFQDLVERTLAVRTSSSRIVIQGGRDS
ncbi:MAG: NRDE family protein [Spirochaetaceae bacterium]